MYVSEIQICFLFGNLGSVKFKDVFLFSNLEPERDKNWVSCLTTQEPNLLILFWSPKGTFFLGAD